MPLTDQAMDPLLDAEVPPTDQDLDRLRLTTIEYYIHETNPANGLIRDKTDPAAPCSIAAVGLGLAAIPVLVERGVISREFAPEIALRPLRFFHDSPHGPEPDSTGYKGFYYHFLDMKSGRRVWECELSTIDSAFLFAGMLTCASYFDGDSESEAEIRRLAETLYRRADWQWALNGGAALSHGWKPETGFIPHRWTGYDEGLLLYLLGLGSPTFPLPAESYAAYCSTYQWKKIYGRELLYSGPLFTHQLSHLWIDFRDLRDAFMREHGTDYFQNSRQATYVHQEYAMRNPLEFAGYGKLCWGVTATDGPGWEKRMVDGIERQFYDYYARGRHTVPMTAQLPHGWLSPRFHSRRRSSYRPFARWSSSTSARRSAMASSRRSTRPTKRRSALRAGGSHHIILASTRVQ